MMKNILAIMILLVATTPVTLMAESDNEQLQTIPTRTSPLSDFELQIWNDQTFQKQFANSYMAETEIEPRVTVQEREQMQKVLELISEDKMDKAEALLIKQRGEASTAVYDFTLANIYFQQEKLEGAAENYLVAVEKYPKFRRAWRNLSLIYIRQGEMQHAIEPLTQVVKLGGGDSLTFGLLGYAYSSNGKSLPAETAYRMAILLDPDTIDWQLGLARSFFKQQRYADASALCSQLIADQPEKTDFWILQANAFIGLNQPLKAAENYELVDRMGGSTVDTLNTLGDIYVNQQLFGLAVDAYHRAMNINPQKTVQRSIRAAKVITAHGALDETQTLIEHINTNCASYLADNDKIDLLKIQARIAVAEGAGDQEAQVLEQIVELDPLDGEALILLGQHSRRNGELEKAVFYYERAASIDKYEADAKIRHAQLLVSRNEYAKALPLLRRAQMIKPSDNLQKYLEQVERISKGR